MTFLWSRRSRRNVQLGNVVGRLSVKPTAWASLSRLNISLFIFRLLKLYSRHVRRQKQLFDSLSWSLVSAKNNSEQFYGLFPPRHFFFFPHRLCALFILNKRKMPQSLSFPASRFIFLLPFFLEAGEGDKSFFVARAYCFFCLCLSSERHLVISSQSPSRFLKWIYLRQFVIMFKMN